MLALYSKKLVQEEAGVTAIEYGLIAALVAVVCIAAWQLLGTHLSTAFNNIASSV
ncbi:MAG: Flp family type IVb pilin [Alphaproteobacteria bacterium]|nr:Flp family type IVb pilin [Alphaproteobacteria bacterium]